jgi:hypothetical protein
MRRADGPDAEAEDREMAKKTETPRTRNREWGFFGTCEHNGHTNPPAAWNEALETLTNPEGAFRMDDETARELLDSTMGRHLADQVFGMGIAAGLNGLAKDRAWARDIEHFVRAHIRNDYAMPVTDPAIAEAARIARTVLRIKTLERQKSDAADFHELAVWTIEEALVAAYNAGRKSARRKEATR